MSTVDMPETEVKSAVDVANAIVRDAKAAIQDALNAPFATIVGGLPDAIKAALLDENGPAVVHSAQYAPTRKNETTLTVILNTGQEDGWQPDGATFNSATVIARGSEKLTRYDRILRDMCAIRGGTIGTIAFAPTLDDNGFRKGAAGSFGRIRRALDAAYMRLPQKDRNRVDTDFRVVANDMNAANASTVEGYVMVRITGFRVK